MVMEAVENQLKALQMLKALLLNDQKAMNHQFKKLFKRSFFTTTFTNSILYCNSFKFHIKNDPNDQRTSRVFVFSFKQQNKIFQLQLGYNIMGHYMCELLSLQKREN